MRISKAGAGMCGALLLAAIAPVNAGSVDAKLLDMLKACLLYTSPSPRDRTRSRMPSSA